jgi:hypothetical protein
MCLNGSTTFNGHLKRIFLENSTKRYKMKILLMPKDVLIRLDIYLLVNKAKGGGHPENFIRTFKCWDYMRLKLNFFEFTERSISSPKKWLVSYRLLKMVYIKFHSK